MEEIEKQKTEIKTKIDKIQELEQQKNDININYKKLEEAKENIERNIMSKDDLAKIKDTAIKLVKKGDLNAYVELIQLLPVDANEPPKTNESIFDFFKRISKKHDDLFFFVYKQLTLITMEDMKLKIENLRNTKFDYEYIQGLKAVSYTHLRAHET